MSKLFDLDSKFMQKATKFGDLVFLNILTVICCIPVITIGPAFTAMHYTLLKLYRDEEGGLFKTYFHSFFGNLRQGILLTLVYLVYFGILVLNYQLGRRTENVMRIVLYVLPFFALVGGMSLCWLFPMLSRYSNTVIGTIKTTLAATLAHPFKSLMMTALMIAPFLILLLTNWGVPILMTIGLSLCGYLRVMLYDPTFKMLERVRDPEEDEEDSEEDAEEDFEEDSEEE